ncbi:hypothetical protein F5J12DRAFT_787580 [Pisolithus orientalis]|uniref:uncharacterized protein n=1 Tax=Pisolithus orientalis TaxID=936130 RepID=UPI0022257784|nr:uncharacterized protein F5J12DRAFT_787580 [Pisolithus orientalis]KAI5984399.1 hypothetical protein F5J12DRAFT_787580 [Pisolithus orientalis]
MLIQKKEHPLAMPYPKKRTPPHHASSKKRTPPCHALTKNKRTPPCHAHPKKKNTPSPSSSKKKRTPPHHASSKKKHPSTTHKTPTEHPLTMPYQKTKEHPLAMLIQKKRTPPHHAHPKKKEHPLTVPHPKKSVPLPLTKHPLAMPHPKKKYVVPVPSIPLPLTKPPLTMPHPKKRTPPCCVSSYKRYLSLLHDIYNETQMVKTKQTAKKTTGGRAPRVSLAGLKAREKHAAKSSKAHARKAPVAKKRRMRNLARMEGHCGLVIRQVAEGYTQGLPCRGHPASCDLQGFYLSGKPVLKHPLVVTGGFEHATTSEVAGNSTAIIHLHLESLELGHAPVHILHTMLQGYFTQDTYHFSQLPFNFATEESRAAYDTAASKLASSLTTFAKVVIFLTTHTDEDRGNLFSGTENKVPIATEVFEGGDLIFFVCGSTVRKEESFQGLKAAVQHFKPRSMLLFDAERLQLVTTIPFLMSVLDSTLVQGFHVQSAVRHSNIILMLWQEKVVVEKFIWTDKFIRPWGQQLPAQCPQCYSIQKWEAGCSGQTYSYECKNPGCGKDTQGTSQPPQTYTICMSKGATKLTHGKGQTSSWLLGSL